MKEIKLRSIVIGWLILLGGFIWLAFKLAMTYYVGISLEDFEAAFVEQLKNPFVLKVTEHTTAFFFVLFSVWLIMFASSFSKVGKYRPNEEHGSAKFGTTKELRRKFDQPESTVVSQDVRMGLNPRKYKGDSKNKNTNMIIIGGAGSGKSELVVKPNALEFVGNYVFTDSKGDLLKSLGGAFLKEGYAVKVLNLKGLTDGENNSHRFNPLAYVNGMTDVTKLVTNLIKNTTDKNATKGDDFWEKGESQLLEAIIYYVCTQLPTYDCNLGSVVTMLNNIKIDEENGGNAVNVIDILFSELEEIEPEHPAVSNYNGFRNTAGKTALGFLKAATSRLKAFNTPAVCDLTCTDELDLGALATEKVALFCVVSDYDSSYNFLAGFLYSQLIDVLFRAADARDSGALERHVAFWLDEFANIAQINEFEKIIAVCRSRNISMKVIIQGMSQIKFLFRHDQWETIVACCSIMLYLGGDEASTHKYISERMGKMTINTQGHNRSRRDLSTNMTLMGRELMTQAEIAVLSPSKCIVLISGEDPVIDDKFDITKHKNFKMIPRGGVVEPYVFRRENENTENLQIA